LSLLFILILLSLFAIPALASKDETDEEAADGDPGLTPAAPQADPDGDLRTPTGPAFGTEPPPYIRRMPAGINGIGNNTGLVRASSQNVNTFDAVRQTVASAIANNRSAPANGPFRAQVLMSYQANDPFRPPDRLAASAQAAESLPWIIARVEGLHEHLPDPASYNSQTADGQLGFLNAVKAHLAVGVFLPMEDHPESPVPNPGEIINVSYSNARTFQGGRYHHVGRGEGGIATPVRDKVNPCGRNVLDFQEGTLPPGSFPIPPPPDFAAANCDSARSGAGFPPAQRRPSSLTFEEVTLRSYDPPADHLVSSARIPDPYGDYQYPVVEIASRTPREFFNARNERGDRFRGSTRPGYGRIRRKEPTQDNPRPQPKIHKGEDVYVPPRSFVYAPFKGTVKYVVDSGGGDYGRIIALESFEDTNFVVRIVHIKEETVSRGMVVEPGTVLGISYFADPRRRRGQDYIPENAFPGGDPSHLHIEVHLKDRPHASRPRYSGNVNPYRMFDVSLLYWPLCSQGTTS